MLWIATAVDAPRWSTTLTIPSGRSQSDPEQWSRLRKREDAFANSNIITRLSLMDFELFRTNFLYCLLLICRDPRGHISINQRHRVQQELTKLFKDRRSRAIIWLPVAARLIRQTHTVTRLLMAATPDLRRRCTGTATERTPANNVRWNGFTSKRKEKLI